MNSNIEILMRQGCLSTQGESLTHYYPYEDFGVKLLTKDSESKEYNKIISYALELTKSE